MLRQQYTPEFKRRAVELLLESGKSIARMAQHIDIKDNIPYNWKNHVQTGLVRSDEFMKNIKTTARQNSRMPYPWDNKVTAGFTTGIPWLKLNPNCQTINLAVQINDPDSIYSYYKKLIKIRHDIPAMT
ncbi:transposase [Brenneria rubrifaciens]|uniref:Glycosyl hydrolase family 13 catalytic domain-containing protein n=1 Tax=Brenneria rubrifaciens TaxID=55213 RepID=A0A4P8QQW9_9GAMM|nr:transposase [Brenneria rubrifaciens]QCR09521.1 hypothetical protein EH207_13925 [Brenneria rubrifaciens]